MWNAVTVICNDFYSSLLFVPWTTRFVDYRRFFVFLTTNPKHESVHFLLDVLVAHMVAFLIHGLQQHVQEGLPLPRATVRVAVWLSMWNVLCSFLYHLSRIKGRMCLSDVSLRRLIHFELSKCISHIYNKHKCHTVNDLSSYVMTDILYLWCHHSLFLWKNGGSSASYRALVPHQRSCRWSRAKTRVSSVCGWRCHSFWGHIWQTVSNHLSCLPVWMITYNPPKKERI